MVPKLAGEHHLAGALQRRDVAVGEVHHVDDACRFSRFRHLQSLRIVFRASGFSQSTCLPAAISAMVVG